MIKYTAGNFIFLLKIHDKIVLEYKKKSSQDWKHKNYSANSSRAKVEKDILKISKASRFTMEVSK